MKSRWHGTVPTYFCLFSDPLHPPTFWYQKAIYFDLKVMGGIGDILVYNHLQRARTIGGKKMWKTTANFQGILAVLLMVQKSSTNHLLDVFETLEIMG